MSSLRVKICALRMLRPAALKRAGDLAEQAGAVPGADFHGVVAAVGFIVPVDDRGQGVFPIGDLEAHEAVCEERGRPGSPCAGWTWK